MPTLAIRLSTQCAHCKQVLPLNRYDSEFVCRGCAKQVDVPPDLWGRLLASNFEDLDDRDVGDHRSETRSIKGHMFELWTNVVAAPTGATRLAEGTMTNVAAFVNEEPRFAPTAEPPRVTCGQCGAAPSKVPAAREFHCEFCQAAAVVADTVWERLHPEDAVKTWYMNVGDDDDDEDLTSSFAIDADMISIEDGAVAIVAYNSSVALVRLDRKCAVKWRVDVKVEAGNGTARLLRVGDEVWLADSAHEATRYALADGKPRGTIGEKEPAGAKQPALDLRELGDWAMLGDGTFVALLYCRLVRYRADGTSMLTWPNPTGAKGVLLGWLLNAHLPPLYHGPDRKHGEMAYDTLGEDKPLDTMAVNRRFAADADSLWIDTGKTVYRYALDGKLLLKVELPHGAETQDVRPVADGKGGLYSVVYDDDHDAHLIAYSDASGSKIFAAKGVGYPKAMMLDTAGLWVFGTQDGEVRHFTSSGAGDHTSRAAIQADRDNSDGDDAEID